ncbi:MAG: hypothetical protein OIF50_15630 [Flavobacteriaceae bacterium]|nr:hypothetical protein [Flavobacteriaceae bacterium]
MQKNKQIYSYRFSKNLWSFLLMAALCTPWLQAQEISVDMDTTHIHIGDQIRYKIRVEIDSTDVVDFPEGQSFLPLETVEISPTDTTKNNQRYILQRIYALTQFDSGYYTLPQQKITINNKAFFTDSARIRVADVAVDTTKQKLYDIKPIIAVEKDHSGWWRLPLYILLALLLLGAVVYWFFVRKKPLSEEEQIAQLPAYDRAILALQQLEKSKYLIQSEYKAYYSQLTDIVRQYLEEDAKIAALESTTDQLIDRINLLNDSGELKLDAQTINEFQQILQTADLVKFARSKPENKLAESHRSSIEQIVTKTKEALPEPTEEELQANQEYLAEMAAKKSKKRMQYSLIGGIGLLVLAFGVTMAIVGPQKTIDTVLRNPSMVLLEKEWVKSEYGYPPVILETPEVLQREKTKIPTAEKANITAIQQFGYNKPSAHFSVFIRTTSFNGEFETELEKAVEAALKQMDKQGAKNLISKNEAFDTPSGIQGLKTFGKGDFDLPNGDQIKGEYLLLHFGGKGFLQQIIIRWEQEDIYAQQIVERIESGLDVKTQI